MHKKRHKFKKKIKKMQKREMGNTEEILMLPMNKKKNL